MTQDERPEDRPQPISPDAVRRGRGDGSAGNPIYRPFTGFPRQRELAARVAETQAAAVTAKEGDLVWSRTDGIWTNADGTEAPIAAMTDARIYDLVTWSVNNRITLCKQYAADSLVIAFGGGLWLRSCPLFQTLVIESCRRRITLPPSVFDYISKMVLPQLERIAEPATPHRDPELLAEQQAVLDRIAGLAPVNPYEQTLRRLDLEE